VQISGRIFCVVILSRAKDLALAAASHKVVGVIATAVVSFLASLRMTAISDFSREIGGEVTGITLLQFRALPVFAGKNFPTMGRAAFAFDRVVVVIGHRPIVREFFASVDVVYSDERDLAAHAEIWIARMIAVKHRTLAFFVGHRRDKQIIVDLNFHWTKAGRDLFAQSFSINDVAAFHRNDFVFCNVGCGE
jgi:hypothetical protein